MVSLGNTFAHLISENKYIKIEDFNTEALEIFDLNETDISEISVLINEEVQNLGELESFFD
jgi:hypothetical protein